MRSKLKDGRNFPYWRVANTLVDDGHIKNMGFSAWAIYCVLVRLANGNDRDQAFPSFNYLQEMTGASRATVCKSITRLIKLGYLSRVHKGQSKGDCNIYELNDDDQFIFETSSENEPVQILNLTSSENEHSLVQNLSMTSLENELNKELLKTTTEKEIEIKPPLSFSEQTPTPPEPEPQPLSTHLVNPDNPGVSATNQAGRFDKSSAADKFSQQPRWKSSVAACDDRFNSPIPAWRASNNPNGWHSWMVEYVRLVVLPKSPVPAFGSDGKHEEVQAINWLANRELEGIQGTAKLESYAAAAQTWWQKRQQSQQPKTATPALAVAEPPPEPERSLPPPEFKNLVLEKWTGGRRNAAS